MVILRIEVGQQVAYFEGASHLAASIAARVAQVPEHLIRAGVLFASMSVAPEVCPTCELVGGYCGGSGHPRCGTFVGGVAA